MAIGGRSGDYTRLMGLRMRDIVPGAAREMSEGDKLEAEKHALTLMKFMCGDYPLPLKPVLGSYVYKKEKKDASKDNSC